MRNLLALGLCVLLVSPVAADLLVDQDLGTMSAGSLNLANTTLGQPNNCDFYNTATWTEALGEYVYEFTLPSPMSIDIAQNTTGGSDNDHFMLNSLATYFDGTYWRSNNSLAFVDESGSFGGFLAGTYYLSVDTYGNSTEGPFDFDLTFTDWTPPQPPVATPVSLPYAGAGNVAAAGDVLWYEFTLGSDTTVDIWTAEAQPTPIGDTEIGLYNQLGQLVGNNDDGGPGGGTYSGLMAMDLAAGTYYLAAAGYNTTFAADFAVTGGTYTGDFMLNITPEPASLMLLGLGAVLLRRRR